MNYSLGNTLSRGGSLNADGLSLDLQFATDKSLTARKGPTPTFTRASTATFVGSNGLIQSAAINQARFDHDPVTLASKGLLIEESRTNLSLQSEGFSTATWQKFGSTVTADSVASPDGAVTADLLVEDVGLSTHGVQQSVPSITAGQPYTFSVFAKSASHTSYQIALSATAFGSNLFANFILTGSGSVGTSSGVTTKIESFPSGWYRCSVTIASVTGGAGGFSTIVINNNNSSATRLPSYLGTGAQAVYLYGAQLEAGAIPTSYIPTTTASVVRSVDVCSITGSAFTGFYNASEGTIAAIGILNTTNTNSAPEVFKVNDGTNNNRIQIGMTNSATEGIRPVIVAAGVVTYNSPMGTVTIGVERKIATAYKSNDTISVFNGTLGTQDTSVTIPTGINQALIGTSFGNGTIASLRYFKKRLPNAKLQTLTT